MATISSPVYSSDSEDQNGSTKPLSRKSTTPVSAPQLFLDAEDVTEEACSSFQRIKKSIYLKKSLGETSDQQDVMTCDCHEEMENGRNIACGIDSDCINRLTNVECVNEDCTCGSDCQNQRFQKRQYSDISVFKTEKKGYGLRANQVIYPDSFVYEYVGEVITDVDYKKRKEEYGDEGIKHFYFMMLQGGEYIDATKKADICRYANHSCNPNCYIDKWVVGTKYRMGLFAKRKIQKGEEITFDYNVDRYGSEAQKCYCGEPNCIGFLGGKTQSESARLLPHAITEALGVSASDEKSWIKEQKKQGIKVTKDNVESKVNVEFVKAVEIRPVSFDDVSKITTCLLQPGLDSIVINKIIERISITNDEEIMVRMSRLHGIQAMSSALKTLLSYAEGREFTDAESQLISDIISILNSWPPLKARNTIQTCKIDIYLAEIIEKIKDTDTVSVAQKLLATWQELEVIFRIPKKENGTQVVQTGFDDRRLYASTSLSSTPVKASSKLPWSHINVAALPEQKKLNGIPLPTGWEWAVAKDTGVIYYFNRDKNVTTWDKPEWPDLPSAPKSMDSMTSEEEKKRKEAEKEKARERENERALLRLKELERIRKQVDSEKEEKEKQKMDLLASIINQASSASIQSASNTATKSKLKDSRSSSSSESDSEKIAKRWHKLFAPVVQEVMQKYKSKLSRDEYKDRAREIVHLLGEKEINKGHLNPPASLGGKESNIKAFTKQFLEKLIAKKREKQKRKLEQSVDGGYKRSKA